jgi:hypothetical protein
MYIEFMESLGTNCRVYQDYMESLCVLSYMEGYAY